MSIHFEDENVNTMLKRLYENHKFFGITQHCYPDSPALYDKSNMGILHTSAYKSDKNPLVVYLDAEWADRICYEMQQEGLFKSIQDWGGKIEHADLGHPDIIDYMPENMGHGRSKLLGDKMPVKPVVLSIEGLGPLQRETCFDRLKEMQTRMAIYKDVVRMNTDRPTFANLRDTVFPKDMVVTSKSGQQHTFSADETRDMSVRALRNQARQTIDRD